jgi:hypothetical protein
VFGDPLHPISLNQWVYGAANPITMWDPTGMSATPSTIREAPSSIVPSSTVSALRESPAPYTPDPPPPVLESISFALMNDSALSWRERAGAASRLASLYGTEGANLVDDWLGSLGGQDATIGLSWSIRLLSAGGGLWWLVRGLRNAGLTNDAIAYAEAHGGRCRGSAKATFVCYGMPVGTYGKDGTTIGNVFLTGVVEGGAASQGPSWNALLGHELVHMDQWAEMGASGFTSNYALLGLLIGECNPFEAAAGYSAGGYGGCNDAPITPMGIDLDDWIAASNQGAD